MVSQVRSSRALLVAALVAGVTAVGPVLPAAGASPHVEAPAQGDHDGDGIVAVSTSVDVPQRRVAVRAGGEHDHHADRSVVVTLDGGPPMVIVEEIAPGTRLGVRSRSTKGWSAWTEVVADPAEAPDAEPTAASTSVGPIWVGRGTDAVELAVLDGHEPELVVTALHLAEDVRTTSRQETTSTTEPDGDTTTTTAEDGESEITTTTTSGTSTTTTTTVPDDPDLDDEFFPTSPDDADFIAPRSAWATAEMGWNCNSGPHEADELRAAVVHHTAGTNGYTRSDVADVIRGIWYYHVRTRGWCDIAYQFLVDRYGGIWEGRQGGIHRAIIGGHARGFNTGTTAVAQLGSFGSSHPTSELVNATRRIIGWKLGVHGIDPAGETTLTNRTGGDFAGVPDDGEVPVATVVGHRDLGTTSCPGDHTHDLLPMLRAQSKLGVHVVALHETFLRSVPAPGQYRSWLATAERDGLAAAARAMAGSDAYAGLIIEDLYQRVLRRSSDASGRAYWLEQLADGLRVADIGVFFYGSAEYVERQGSHEAWVRALYQNLLHREPEARGLAYWVDLLDRGRALPPDVADGFYASIESRNDRVTRTYRAILGRDPDSRGLAHWAQLLADVDDVALAVELSLSDEFYDRAT